MWGKRLVPIFAAAVAAGALASAAHADNRVALIIGNSDYKNVSKLSNAVNDARAIKATLKSIGFKVVYGEDLDKRDMERAVGVFAKEANNADVAVVYYSGHGSTFGDVPYMVPVDARYDSLEEVKHELVPIEEMVGELRRAKGVRLALLDTCRDNEAEQRLKAKSVTRGLGETRGLGRIGNTDGLIVAYSTQFLDTALDGAPGGNSPFTAALLKNLPTPGVDIKAMLFKTAAEVVQTTRGNQRPEVQVSLYQDYTLVPAAGVGAAVPEAVAAPAAPIPAPVIRPVVQAASPQVRPFSIAPTVPAAAPRAAVVVPGLQEEAAYWQLLERQPSEAAYRDYLDKVGRRVFPGTFATVARVQLAAFAAEAQRRNEAAAAQAERERLAAAQEAQRIAGLSTQQLLDALGRLQPEEARRLVARLSPAQRAALEQALVGAEAEVQQASVPEIEATEFSAPQQQVRRAIPTRTVAPRVAPRRETFAEPEFQPQPRRLLREASFEDAPRPRRFEGRFEGERRFQGEDRPRREGGGRQFEGGGRGDGFRAGRGDGGGQRFQAQAGGFGGGRGRF